MIYSFSIEDIHENSNSSQIQIQQPTSVPTQSNASTIISGVSAITAAAAVAAGIGPIVGSASGSMGSVLSSASQSAATSLPTSVTTQGSGAPTQGNLITTNVTKKTESVSKMGNTDAINTENIQDDTEKEMMNKKDQNHKQQRLSKIIESSSAVGKDTDMVIEPKSEYDDDGNDETVEDLTLDDEEMGLEDLDHNAGPSHGEGSSQGRSNYIFI